jgi:hypothetical protein
LDLGTSAGLNLLFDHYRYEYRQRSDGTVTAAGDPTSAVQLDCVVRNDLAELPPFTAPPMAGRVGLDLSPIDPTSADGARWLLACLWPDNLPRFNRLRHALDIARDTEHPPVIHRGDIVSDLTAVAATIDPSTPLVVFHSWVAAYLTQPRQRELVEAVRSIAATRPVHHLYAEQVSETPGLPTPPSPQDSPNAPLRTALVHIDLTSLTEHAHPPAPVRLADMHPHGRWLHWWQV